MEKQNILTRVGLKNLKKELKDLIEVARPKVIQEIKDARDQGDLSENAEFDAARELQGKIEDRISEIEEIIDHSQVLTVRSSSTKVRIGSEVTVQEIKSSEKSTYTIVGTLETDPVLGRISNISLLAQAILGQEVGAVVTVLSKPKYDIKIVGINNSKS